MKRSLMLVVVVMAFVFSGIGFCETPARLHLSWNDTNGASSSMVVTWDTGANDGAQVIYGKTTSLELGTLNGSSWYSGRYAKYLHTVKLTALEPFTMYYYQCGSTTGWSTTRSFKTAPSKGDHTKNFTFAANGDCRTNAVPRQTITNLVKGRNPVLYLFGGDIAEVGTERNFWYKSMDDLDTLISNCPFMTCPGNHDDSENSGSSYHDIYDFPNGDKWYSFNYGNIHFVSLLVLQDGNSINMFGDQKSWLQSDLAAANSDPDIKWKVVMVHTPLYTDGGTHPSNTTLRNEIGTIFENYGVDICFQAHNHHYYRTKKLRYDTCVTENGPDYNASTPGTVYVTVGGAGAPLHGGTPSSWAVTLFADKYSYCTIDVDNTNNKLIGKAYDDSNVLRDQFSIIKTVASKPPPSRVVYQELLMAAETSAEYFF